MLYIHVGNACQYKVVGVLCKRYASPKVAEEQIKESPSGSLSDMRSSELR